jgi:hypothetical protein
MNQKAESEQSTVLLQFVRESRGKQKGQPRGVVVATYRNGKVTLGWSYTNKKMGDSFNKTRGIDNALNRTEFPTGASVQIPHAVNKELDKLSRRAQKYFKVEEHQVGMLRKSYQNTEK